jgi:hypothetical protein
MACLLVANSRVQQIASRVSIGCKHGAEKRQSGAASAASHSDSCFRVISIARRFATSQPPTTRSRRLQAAIRRRLLHVWRAAATAPSPTANRERRAGCQPTVGECSRRPNRHGPESGFSPETPAISR